MTNKLNVLIVEDDENDCKALVAEINANADKLCLAGVSKSSDDALAFIRNHKPHAVILAARRNIRFGTSRRTRRRNGPVRQAALDAHLP